MFTIILPKKKGFLRFNNQMENGIKKLTIHSYVNFYIYVHAEALLISFTTFPFCNLI